MNTFNSWAFAIGVVGTAILCPAVALAEGSITGLWLSVFTTIGLLALANHVKDL